MVQGQPEINKESQWDDNIKEEVVIDNWQRNKDKELRGIHCKFQETH